MSNINTQTLNSIAEVRDCFNHDEPLFTDLPLESAAVVEGGGSFGFPINFDSFQSTGPFRVRPGGAIAFASKTISSIWNRYFSASIRNVTTGARTEPKLIRVGQDITSWTGMRGGTYRLELYDTRDGIRVSGSGGVGYTS